MHTALVNVKENAASNKPVIIAPTRLVATNSIARRISASNTVASIPIKNSSTAVHKQLPYSEFLILGAVSNATRRNATAIPKTTHKKTGVTVIVAEYVRKTVITPIIALTMIENNAQSHLLLHSHEVIISPPLHYTQKRWDK